MNPGYLDSLKNSARNLRGKPTSALRFSVSQGGLVLLLSLALLAGLSLLALLAASSMLQQQRMAANHSDGELARLAAMTAVQAGEKFLFSLPNEARIEGCQTDCFVEPARSMIMRTGIAPDQAEFLPDEWWLQWGQPMASAFDGDSLSANPRPAWTLPGRQPPLFIIQELEFLVAPGPQLASGSPVVSGIAYYQVLGRGTGLSGSNTHVAESILARPWLASSPENSSPLSDCSMFRPAYDCGRMAYRERR